MNGKLRIWRVFWMGCWFMLCVVVVQLRMVEIFTFSQGKGVTLLFMYSWYYVPNDITSVPLSSPESPESGTTVYSGKCKQFDLSWQLICSSPEFNESLSHCSAMLLFRGLLVFRQAQKKFQHVVVNVRPHFADTEILLVLFSLVIILHNTGTLRSSVTMTTE